MQGGFLEPDVYRQAISSFVIVAADVCIINPKRRSLFLAHRAIKPMPGLWWIGGRRFAGETPAQAAVRCFQRETKLVIAEKRLAYVMPAEYVWRDREQEPQGVGCHYLCDTFALELSDDELSLASANLDRVEFAPGGLREFDRGSLVRALASRKEGGGNPVQQVLLDFYDQVFP